MTTPTPPPNTPPVATIWTTLRDNERLPRQLKVDPILLDAVPYPEQATFNALVQSIELRGQHDPITVARRDDGSLLVVDGHSRLAACMVLNREPEIEVSERFSKLDDKELLFTAIELNLFRRHLTSAQRKEVWLKLRNLRTMTDKSVAEILGVTDRTIQRWKRSEGLTDQDKAEAIRQGRTNTTFVVSPSNGEETPSTPTVHVGTAPSWPPQAPKTPRPLTTVTVTPKSTKPHTPEQRRNDEHTTVSVAPKTPQAFSRGFTTLATPAKPTATKRKASKLTDAEQRTLIYEVSEYDKVKTKDRLLLDLYELRDENRQLAQKVAKLEGAAA